MEKALHFVCGFLAIFFFILVGIKQLEWAGAVCGAALGYFIVNFLDLGIKYFRKNI